MPLPKNVMPKSGNVGHLFSNSNPIWLNSFKVTNQFASELFCEISKLCPFNSFGRNEFILANIFHVECDKLFALRCVQRVQYIVACSITTSQKQYSYIDFLLVLDCVAKFLTKVTTTPSVF